MGSKFINHVAYYPVDKRADLKPGLIGEDAGGSLETMKTPSDCIFSSDTIHLKNRKI